MKAIIASNNYVLVGWQEWCALPQLGIPAIKAKMDTGAKTSALHAFNIEVIQRQQKKFVHFQLHPLQFNDKIIRNCSAELIDQRYIMSSNGHKELRYVIKTELVLGETSFDIHVTLSNRDPLSFRMLLGREVLSQRIVVDAAHAMLLKKISARELKNLYAPASKS